jgi:hypothetical protein
VALLDESPSPPPDLPQVASGTATVDVTSEAGSARAVLVTFTRFAETRSIAFVEDWPDGAHHTYVGSLISPTDLEVWPAQVRTT